jgi:hypothetical protein
MSEQVIPENDDEECPLSDLGHKHDNFAKHYCPNIARALAAEAKVAGQAEAIKLYLQMADQQAATIERLTMAMRDMEWCGLSDYCLLCGRTKKEGHNSVCRLDAALNKQVHP